MAPPLNDLDMDEKRELSHVDDRASENDILVEYTPTEERKLVWKLGEHAQPNGLTARHDSPPVRHDALHERLSW